MGKILLIFFYTKIFVKVQYYGNQPYKIIDKS